MDESSWLLENDSTSVPELGATSASGNGSAIPTMMPFSEVTAVIYAIVFIVGFLGNTLTIYVVVRYAKLKTVTNMYILNLAVADEIYILGIPFLGTNSVLSYWPFGEFFCKLCMTADGLSQFASTFCLTFMSVDRFLAVVYPIRSAKWRKLQVAKIVSGVVWVVSFLVVLPVTVYSHVQDDLNTCNISWPEPGQVWSVVFILYTSILGFFGPLVIITIGYLLIVIKVRSAGVRAGMMKRRRSERKVTRMVVIIVLVFVVCWMPFYTTNIVNLVHIIPENQTMAAVYFSLVLLTYVNSCANPVLYGFLSDNFRQSFQKALCFHKNKNPAAVSTNTGQTGGRQNDTKSVQMEVMGNADTEPFSSKAVANGQ